MHRCAVRSLHLVALALPPRRVAVVVQARHTVRAVLLVLLRDRVAEAGAARQQLTPPAAVVDCLHPLVLAAIRVVVVAALRLVVAATGVARLAAYKASEQPFHRHQVAQLRLMAFWQSRKGH